MAFYYCNCIDDEKKLKEGRSVFRKVEADDDGICKECGYYAVGVRREARNPTDLYYMTAGYKDGDEKTTRNNKNDRERRWRAEKKAKASDLDI